MKNTEIVIIGAGMAGIASAVYLKRTNADFVLIDGNEIGGQLNKISDIENYPTILKNSGLEISFHEIKKIGEDVILVESHPEISTSDKLVEFLNNP